MMKKWFRKYYGLFVLSVFTLFTCISYFHDRLVIDTATSSDKLIILMAPNAESFVFVDWFKSFISMSGWGLMPLMITIIVSFVWMLEIRYEKKKRK